MRVLLNGVGRIGKAIIRIALESKAFDVVAINELNSNIENIAYSINYDSTYGRIKDQFNTNHNMIYNSAVAIKVLNHASLLEVDYAALKIDYIIDASGSSVDVTSLKTLPVKAVFLTHPNSEADINVIIGVNEDALDSNFHKVISTSSCNATALLPIIKLIDDNFTIECAEITTIHPLLNHQKLLDSGCVGSRDRHIACSFEFGRSASQNIIPSKTTTIEACSYILPHINAEKIASNSLRVPTPTVGVIDATFFVKDACSKEKLLQLCYEYENNQKFSVMRNNTKALVSSDFIAEHYTTILDHRFTDVKIGKMVKLVIWYDNEWGYASKVVDIVRVMDATF